MYKMKASEFKAKCLHIMDEINISGETVIITKNGKPVSKLVPYRRSPNTLFGLHKKNISSRDDLIKPIEIEWDADK